MSVCFVHACSPVCMCASVTKIDKTKEKQVASSWSFLVSLSHYGNRLLPPTHTSVYLAFLFSHALLTSFLYPSYFFFIICWSPIALHRPIQLSSDCESQLFLNTWTHLFLNVHFQLHSVQLKHVSEVTLVA